MCIYLKDSILGLVGTIFLRGDIWVVIKLNKIIEKAKRLFDKDLEKDHQILLKRWKKKFGKKSVQKSNIQ